VTQKPQKKHKITGIGTSFFCNTNKDKKMTLTLFHSVPQCLRNIYNSKMMQRYGGVFWMFWEHLSKFLGGLLKSRCSRREVSDGAVHVSICLHKKPRGRRMPCSAYETGN
jgi:hypothetical protein